MTYVRPKYGKALTLAILTGWLGVLLFDIFTLLALSSNLNDLAGAAQSLTGFIVVYIFIGLPIAFVFGAILGATGWLIMLRFNKTTRRDALIFGGCVGFVLGLPTYLFFLNQKDFALAHVDLLSTILIGIIAGGVFHKYLKFPMSNPVETFT